MHIYRTRQGGAKMRDTKTILNDYRKGTPEERLNLFLFHRELRCAFDALEKEEHAPLERKKRINFPFVLSKNRYLPVG